MHCSTPPLLFLSRRSLSLPQAAGDGGLELLRRRGRRRRRSRQLLHLHYNAQQLPLLLLRYNYKERDSPFFGKLTHYDVAKSCWNSQNRRQFFYISVVESRSSSTSFLPIPTASKRTAASTSSAPSFAAAETPPPTLSRPPRHQPRQNPLGTDLASLLVLRTDASCVPLLLLSLPPPIVRRATAKDEKGFFPEIFAPFFSRICQTECGSDLKFRMWHPPRPVYTPS